MINCEKKIYNWKEDLTYCVVFVVGFLIGKFLF